MPDFKLQVWFVSFIVFLCIGHVAYAQEQKTFQDAATSWDSGDRTRAIEIADKIIRDELKRNPRDARSIATVYISKARLQRRTGSGTLSKQVKRPSTVDEIEAIQRDREAREKSIRDCYRSAIAIYESELTQERDVHADLLTEYAGYLAPNPTRLGTKDVSDAINLLERSLSLTSSAHGETDIRSVTKLYVLARFHFDAGDFESAAPLYARFLGFALDIKTIDRQFLDQTFIRLLSLYNGFEDKTMYEDFKSRLTSVSAAEAELLDLTSRTRIDYFDQLLKDSDTIRSYTRTVKEIEVRVTIDESGNVIEATNSPTDAKDFTGQRVTIESLKSIRTWKFRPMLLNGRPAKYKGFVRYNYLIRAK